MIICTGRSKRYLYWIRQMSVREERHCEMMMAQDALKPDVRFYVSRSTREITCDIFARKIFPASGHVSSRRDVLVLVGKATYHGPRRIHVRDHIFVYHVKGKTGPRLAPRRINCKRKITRLLLFLRSNLHRVGKKNSPKKNKTIDFSKKKNCWKNDFPGRC